MPRTSPDDLTANGEWQEGRWRVLFKRSRGIVDESNADSTGNSGDLVFRKGQFIPVSFANWDGNNGEKGSKHTLTPWFWLLLPHETNYTLVYGAPLATSLVFFVAGVILVWSKRRQHAHKDQGEPT